MKKYEMVVLQRATASEKPKHSALESWLSPAALRHLVQVGLEGPLTDAADAAELLVITLFGLRITSLDGWDVSYTPGRPLLGHYRPSLSSLGLLRPIEGGTFEIEKSKWW